MLFFDVICKKYSPNSKSQGFYTLGFAFGSVIPLELVLVYDVRYDSKFIFCACGYPVFQDSLLKKNYSFSTELNYLCTFVENERSICVWSISILFMFDWSIFLFLCKYSKLSSLLAFYNNS